jgi:uncharacterized protein (DUF58 family)
MRRVLAAVGALAAGTLLAVAAWSSMQAPAATSAFGSAPDPLTQAAADLGWTAQRLDARPAALANDPAVRPADAVLAVVAPSSPYGDADREAVQAFVAAGGLLLVADDGGEGNSLLQPFSLATERVRLVEAAPDWRWGVGDAAIAPLLPSPTAILAPPGATFTALATSSATSFLDRDGAGLVDAGDGVGPFPVAVRQPFGEGAVIVVADAHAFQGDDGLANLPWIVALLESERPDGALLLADESWMAQDAGLATLAWLRTSGAAGAGRLALAGLAAAAMGLVLLRQADGQWQAHEFRPLRFLRRTQAAGTASATARPSPWSGRGAVAICAIPVLVLAWALLGSPQAGVAAGLLMAAVGMAFLVHVPRLSATRTLSQQRTVEGSSVAVTIALRGRRRGPADVELRDALPPEVDVVDGTPWASLAAASGGLAYTVAPGVRGQHPIGPLSARRVDALGLRHAEAEVTAADLLDVVPRAVPSRRAPFRARVPTVTMGPHRVNRAGDGTEFHALRPYIMGDPFRSVNWKASARTKDLMVNQRVHESRTCLTLVVDARAVAGAGPAAQTPLARSCRAALSVATGSVRMRDRVRFAWYGEGVHELPVRPAVRQIHEMSELLARLEARGRTTLEAAMETLLPTLRPGNPVVIVSGFEEDRGAPAALARLRGRGIPVWALSPPPITQPADADEGGPEPGAEAIAAERREILHAVRSAGIPLVEVAADIPLDDLFRIGGAA